MEDTEAAIGEGLSDPRVYTAGETTWTPEQKNKWERGFRANAKFMRATERQKRDEAATRQQALESRAQEIRGSATTSLRGMVPSVLSEALGGAAEGVQDLLGTGLRAVGQGELADTAARLNREEQEARALGSRLPDAASNLVSGVSRSLFTMAPLALAAGAAGLSAGASQFAVAGGFGASRAN